MNEMNEINEMVLDHQKWLREEGGKRGDFSGMELRHTDFSDLDLSGASMQGVVMDRVTMIHSNLSNVAMGQSVLTYCYLRGADMTHVNASEASMNECVLLGVDLTRSFMKGVTMLQSNLSGARLVDATLEDARLMGSSFRGADLTRAYLAYANLTDADLTDADLTGCNLTGCDLTNVKWSGSNLKQANLTKIKEDFWSVLLHAPREIEGLMQALREGRVDGSTYEGECACLVGTIANVRGVGVARLGDIRPNMNRPAERWFLAIRKGDTPDHHPVARITMEWIEEFLSLIRSVPTTI